MTALVAADRTPLERLQGTIDSVYFLMYDGWERELESNRWHFARRWARQLPVTLLQPRQPFARAAGPVASAEIDNCEILPIARSAFTGAYQVRGLAQAAQVMEHMRERGHVRPLLWCYNPGLAPLYAAVPAAARVYHASENHFDFEGVPELFHLEVEATVRISDLVVAVSSGVADGIRSRVPDARLQVVTNGCDVAHYQPTGPGSPEISALREGYGRVAVFGGNINGRIDFDLTARAAAESSDTLLVFVGPVGSLEERDLDAWRRICELPNVRHLGRMAPTDLAAVYRSADLGFIPYRRDPWLVRNGFPLKTLEMAATGLPVVASRMEPIVGLASAVSVAEDDEGFLRAFSSRSRATLSDGDRTELLEVAAASDYDRKFEEVVGHLVAALPAEGRVETRLDALVAALGHDSWRASCTRIAQLGRPPVLWRGLLLAYERLAEVIPDETRHLLIPSAVRRWARGRVAE